MPQLDGDGRVMAAGGVVLVEGRVCVIHRPKYEDWSLPKGKLEAGEDHDAALLREVLEETGLQAVPERELTPHEYVDRKGRPKLVRWWRMRAAEAPFTANHEVDDRRFVTPDEAERLLDYEHDRALVREALDR